MTDSSRTDSSPAFSSFHRWIGDSTYYGMLARLNENMPVDSVVQWEYRNPVPTDFLGGIEYIEVGRTPYVPVNLSPGLFLSQCNYFGGELPVMHKEFTIE